MGIKKLNLHLRSANERLTEIRSIGGDFSDYEFWKCIIDDINALFDIIIYSDWSTEGLSIDIDKMTNSLNLVSDTAVDELTHFQLDQLAINLSDIMREFFSRIKRMSSISTVRFVLDKYYVGRDGSVYLNLKCAYDRDCSRGGDLQVRLLAGKLIEHYAKTFSYK